MTVATSYRVGSASPGGADEPALAAVVTIGVPNVEQTAAYYAEFGLAREAGGSSAPSTSGLTSTFTFQSA